MAQGFKELVAHQISVDADDSLEEVLKKFKTHPFDYMGVLENGKILGLVSRGRLGYLLGTQFGFSLYSRHPIREHLIKNFFTVFPISDLVTSLELFFNRPAGEFHDDAVLIEEDGSFGGIIPMRDLVLLQTGILAEKMRLLEAEDAKLRAANEQLISAAVELNSRSAELQLSHDAALEGNRLKSAILMTMSHELRTPINGILGMSDLLHDTQLSDEQKELLEILRNSGQALLTIVQQVLDYSKLESERVELNPEIFDFRQMMDEILGLFSPMVASAKLALNVDIEDTLPDRVFADRQRLRQVFVQLIGNAVKFTSQGNVCVCVQVRERTLEKVLVEIIIRDTGIGMSSEILAGAFTPFKQGDDSTTRKFGGIGLGLALTRKLVDLIGGTLSLESNKGVGTKVTLLVPFGIPGN